MARAPRIDWVLWEAIRLVQFHVQGLLLPPEPYFTCRYSGDPSSHQVGCCVCGMGVCGRGKGRERSVEVTVEAALRAIRQSTVSPCELQERKHPEMFVWLARLHGSFLIRRDFNLC